jgi:SOS regulatory protein LexA
MPTFETYKAKLIRFYRQRRRMPSYGEIMRLVGFKSKFAAIKLVQKLIAAGVVTRDASGRLIPKNIGEAIRVLGYVEAGWPSPADEELIDTITLDEYLIPRNKEATYIVKVTGRSMVNAGILPGDQVIVERGKQPKEGDIVIAQVDGSWTIKYYRKKGGKIVLYPANPDFKPIVPGEELVIAAVVNAVIRKY